MEAKVCGSLLYAALTARWPAAEDAGLEPAPLLDGVACAPRQVRAGLPAALDDIACRALGLPAARRGAPPLHTAEDVAAALHATHAPGVDEPALPVAEPALRATPPSRWVRLLRLAPGAVLLAGLALLGWQVVDAVRSDEPSDPVRERAASPRPSATPVAVRPVGAEGFDPLGDGVEGVGGRAVDGDPETSWTTATYFRRPDLGGLKSGVGLLLDLGRAVRVSEVRADITPGADVQVFLLASEPTEAPTGPPATTVTDAPEQVAVDVPGDGAAGTPARYVLLWLTRLPPAPEDPTNYRGEVREVTVRAIR
ncbi:hypothetical protein G9H71_22660 [Motilibacter sp. E257]|uniref:Uncharacterized protein n=1 Tax=Motilibacter deserti TaxID=2714956 RepID=A0ABX0H019_9ACTN|nr:hypothetical protein [Motilibacter deserti]